MNETFQTVNDILLDGYSELKSSYKWMEFLNSASWTYKYNFNEQVLLSKQRSDAIAFASYEEWKRVGRHVKRGSTGIALLDLNNRLKYVFDSKDTYSDSGNDFNLWSVKNKDGLREWINTKYKLDTKEVNEAILKMANIHVGNYIDTYMDELETLKTTKIAQFTTKEKKDIVQELLINSTAYKMMKRFDVATERIFNEEDFENIGLFSSVEAMSYIGNITQEVSKSAIINVARSLKEINIERLNKDEQENHIQNESERIVNSTISNANGNQNRLSDDVSELSEEKPEELSAISADDESIDDNSPKLRTQSNGDGESYERKVIEKQCGNNRGEHDVNETIGIQSDDEINLFDFDYDNHFEQIVKPNELSIPDEAIDIAITYGHNKEYKLSLLFEMSKDKPLKDKVSIIKEMLNKVSTGVVYDGKQYTFSYADDGIHIARGNGAILNNKAKILTWEEYTVRLQSLIDDGKFATKNEIDEFELTGKKDIIEKLGYIYMDLADNDLKERLFPSLANFSYSKIEELAKKIDDKEFYELLKTEYSEFVEEYHNNADIMRFHYHYVDSLQNQLNELAIQRKEIVSNFKEDECVELFITNDEINKDLLAGSGFSFGKSRIYEFFSNKHSKSEKAEFLKNEYGIGGRSPIFACSQGSQDHDSKGIRYTKSNCDDLDLSWSNVADRIQKLVDIGLYNNMENINYLNTRCDYVCSYIDKNSNNIIEVYSDGFENSHYYFLDKDESYISSIYGDDDTFKKICNEINVNDDFDIDESFKSTFIEYLEEYDEFEVLDVINDENQQNVQ